jgi:hypothetical protein
MVLTIGLLIRIVEIVFEVGGSSPCRDDVAYFELCCCLTVFVVACTTSYRRIVFFLPFKLVGGRIFLP